jgi:hypothetical protein
MNTSVLYNPKQLAQLYKAIEQIVFVTAPFHEEHVAWMCCAHKLIDKFRYQLHGVLCLDFKRYWDYFHQLLTDDSSYGANGGARSGVITFAATLIKSVRYTYIFYIYLHYLSSNATSCVAFACL